MRRGIRVPKAMLDRSRLARRLGTLDEPCAEQVLAVLAGKFAP
jgi:hypothetical protein